jgi:hypothetical protein
VGGLLARHRTLVAVCLALLLQLLVFALFYPHLWPFARLASWITSGRWGLRYSAHDISDITIYFAYAAKIASGLEPYKDFPIEYPPLAVPLFTVAGNGLDYHVYQRWFSFEMFVFTLAAAAAIVAAAAAIWPRGSRPFAAAATFAVFTVAMGSIVENRFDIVVALSIVVCVWLLARRDYELAGLVLGLGFAVKVTPVVLLPVVLLLAGWNRRALWSLALFVLAALLPFIPWLIVAPGGVEHAFLYHLDRPLQIESVLGTPLFVWHLLGRLWIEVGTSYGSQSIAARGAAFMARLSGPLTAVALALTYVLVARRRALLRATPRHLPLVALASASAFMVFGKVLSPPFLIWLLPVAALVLLDDLVVGILALATVVMTQVEFPGLYWSLVYLEKPTIAVLIVRNLLLVATFVAAMVRLWLLPASPDEAAAPGESRDAVLLRPEGVT